MTAHGLFGIDIDANKGAVQCGRALLVPVVIGGADFGADGQNDIRFRHQGARCGQARIGGDGKGMAGRQNTAAIHGHDDRGIETLGQFTDFIGCVDGSAANQQKRRAG